MCKLKWTGVDNLKTSTYQENWYQQLVDVGRNRPWVFLLGAIYIIFTTFVLTNPNGFPVPLLDSNFVQFGLSITALLLLLTIGVYLLNNDYQLIWGFSFLAYAITFLGLSLEALGFADMSNPIVFLFWRAPMIFFVSGMWIGASKLFSAKNKVVYLPALLILVLGASWFFFGLVVLADIKLTMYGFLYGGFIPMTLSLAYMWSRFNKDTIFSSPWLVTLGFLLMGIIYSLWIPWQLENLSPIYYILFTLFSVALFLILRGFQKFSEENLIKC